MFKTISVGINHNSAEKCNIRIINCIIYKFLDMWIFPYAHTHTQYCLVMFPVIGLALSESVCPWRQSGAGQEAVADRKRGSRKYRGRTLPCCQSGTRDVLPSCVVLTHLSLFLFSPEMRGIQVSKWANPDKIRNVSLVCVNYRLEREKDDGYSASRDWILNYKKQLKC